MKGISSVITFIQLPILLFFRVYPHSYTAKVRRFFVFSHKNISQ